MIMELVLGREGKYIMMQILRVSNVPIMGDLRKKKSSTMISRRCLMVLKKLKSADHGRLIKKKSSSMILGSHSHCPVQDYLFKRNANNAPTL